MTSPPVSIQLDDELAVVHIDHPPVNALSVSVRQGLLDALNQTETDPGIKAVILMCQGRTFIAGADIREFGQAPQEPHLPDLINRIEAASKPWIAALHGTALGGGLELAMGCHFRIATASAELGLPEVTLGLIPGAGGTVRLPRLIGAEAALNLILRGKPISAPDGKKQGLIDEISPSDLARDAKVFAQKTMREPMPQPLLDKPLTAIDDNDAWCEKLNSLKHKHAAQHAHLAAIEAIQNCIALPGQQALSRERELFIALKDGAQSAALRYLFMAERSDTRLPQLKDVEAATFAHIGVVGGGTMGAGIASACLLAGLHVTLIERDTDALSAGEERVFAILANSLQRQLITDVQHRSMINAFTPDTQYTALGNADMVIEAVFEDMGVKQSVFKLLEEHTGSNAILASNTSYLDVNQIAETLKNPERVIGLHFFSPAHIMKLLELIVTDHAAPRTLSTGFALAKRLQKICVPAGVCEGFIGNRIMSAYRRSCDEMLEDGAMPADIDKAMTAFGFPMGIFQMQDLAGLDIAWAMRKRQAAFRSPGDRYVGIADRLCELGRFGRKTGRGWYVYDGSTASVDEEVESIILSESARHGIKREHFSADRIMHTILTTMQNEGMQVLQDGIARSSEAIDVVMVNGYGFPRWRGGPMYMSAETAHG